MLGSDAHVDAFIADCTCVGTRIKRSGLSGRADREYIDRKIERSIKT